MAAFDFPPNASHPAAPALGDKWPQPPVPGLPVYTWDGEKWTTKGGATGSTGVSNAPPLMDGVANAGLSLEWSRGDHVHPTDTSHVAKTYVDAQDALKLDKTGGTLTGPLFLPAAAPTGATQATPKSYVDGILAPPPPFAAGTVMLFYQSAAPTGWTKVTTHTDKVLRVTSGSGGGAGGVQAFSTVFGRTATDNFTLSTASIPAHTHVTTSSSGTRVLDYEQAGSWDYAPGGQYRGGLIDYTTGSGSVSGGAHSHTIDLRVQYVDIILASKN